MTLWTIYLVCAVAGGTVLLLKLLLMIFGIGGGDAEVDFDAADLDYDISTDAGYGSGGVFNFFSIQSIAGFFTMFGLVGMGLMQVNASDFWSFIGGLAAGVFTAWATGMIFLGMRKLHSEGTLVLSNAIGQQGSVYLTIPENGSGVITVTIQGSKRTLNAMSEKGQRIPTGSIVNVVGVKAGNILVVTDQLQDT
ncbi:MAG: NfeD family protein [Anaerolineales bacterium]|nr:NfeD family protein [Anaerolineales bacterium]